MSLTRQAYLEVLFDKEDFSCFARKLTDQRIFSVSHFQGDKTYQWVALNALKPDGKKCVADVVKCRNFLIESDTLSIPDQVRLFEIQHALPYSVKTFSGNKSLHYIISLQEPLDMIQYYKVSKQLKMIFGSALDKTCVNPQCFTRLPDSINQKTYRWQKLEVNNGRISNALFFDWLERQPFQIMQDVVEQDLFQSSYLREEGSGSIYDLPYWVFRYIQDGISKDTCEERHRTLLVCALECCRLGIAREKAQELLLEAFLRDNPDKTQAEGIRTIAWAFDNFATLRG